MKKILKLTVILILILSMLFAFGCDGNDVDPGSGTGQGQTDDDENNGGKTDDEDEDDEEDDEDDEDETDDEDEDDDEEDGDDDEDPTLVGGSLENNIDKDKYKVTVDYAGTRNIDDTYYASDYPNVFNITFSKTAVPSIKKGTSQSEYVGSDILIENDGNNNFVIAALKKEIRFALKGELDGSVAFLTTNKFAIVLDGVSIKSADRPAINIITGKRAFVVVNSNTTNSLEDAQSYDEDLGQKIYDQIDGLAASFDIPSAEDIDFKGTFFSEAQVIFSGTGTLNITAKRNHALVCDDYIRFWNGTFNFTSKGDTIHVNDYIIIDGGTFDLKPNSDAIDVEDGFVVINGGKIDINTTGNSGKGITAGMTSPHGTVRKTDNGGTQFKVGQVYINNGLIVIGRSEEGLEAKSEMFINDGFIYINAYDDAISVIHHLTINDGYIYCYGELDGVDADAPGSTDKITVWGGVLFITGKNGSIDHMDGLSNPAITCKMTIYGGIVVSLANYAPRPHSDSTQNSVVLGSGTKGTAISIKKQTDNGEETIISYVAPLDFRTSFISTPDITQGDDYKVYYGGYSKSNISFYGLHLSGTYKRGTVKYDYNQTSFLTRVSGIFWGGAIS